MTQTLRLGRIAGVPVGVHWSVLGIMLLLMNGLAVVILPGSTPGLPWSAYWGAAVIAALLFLASLLAHEMAHAIVARRYGIRVERVTLWLLGGVAEFADEPPHARADLLVAAVGPFVSLITGVFFGLVGYASAALGLTSLITATLIWLAFVNVILAVFNLLPGAPLDGGRVLRAILWRWRGDRDWAAIGAARAGYALGMLLIAGGVVEAFFGGVFSGVWLVLVGWFLITAARAELAAARYHAQLSDIAVETVMSRHPECGDPTQSVEDFVQTVARSSHHRDLPLADQQGHPIGVVRLTDLRRVPENEREHTALSEVAVPVGDVLVARPDEPVAEVAPVLARGGLALVVDDTVLVGVVSAEDVARATELVAFNRRGQGRSERAA